MKFLLITATLLLACESKTDRNQDLCDPEFIEDYCFRKSDSAFDTCVGSMVNGCMKTAILKERQLEPDRKGIELIEQPEPYRRVPSVVRISDDENTVGVSILED